MVLLSGSARPTCQRRQNSLFLDGVQARGEGLVLDQFANEDNPRAHRHGTAPEIWAQTGGRVTHFVASMGTTGTIMGASRCAALCFIVSASLSLSLSPSLPLSLSFSRRSLPHQHGRLPVRCPLLHGLCLSLSLSHPLSLPRFLSSLSLPAPSVSHSLVALCLTIMGASRCASLCLMVSASLIPSLSLRFSRSLPLSLSLPPFLSLSLSLSLSLPLFLSLARSLALTHSDRAGTSRKRTRVSRLWACSRPRVPPFLASAAGLSNTCRASLTATRWTACSTSPSRCAPALLQRRDMIRNKNL